MSISGSENINKPNNDNNLNNIKIEESETDFIDHNRIELIPKLFNDKQMNRYGEYKKCSLENRKKNRSTNKIEFPRIKRIIQGVIGEHISVSNPVQVIMHGIAKIHAGELIEEAKKILYEELEFEGVNDFKPKPIRPKHLREARRRMMLKGNIPGFKPLNPIENK